MRAVIRGTSDVVQMLLNAEADVNARDTNNMTVLYAVSRGTADTVNMVLDKNHLHRIGGSTRNSSHARGSSCKHRYRFVAESRCSRVCKEQVPLLLCALDSKVPLKLFGYSRTRSQFEIISMK
ncbi:MAG: hypothetical protein A6F71_10370 [Cycloclasticus sp. symbiont of Poecilosclerida sp. M]|nr:MAG: hypothetical protein A6F71_10370 [Cycloclasticus sp. symbiont of Poecilosclerida sp. M]